MIQQVKVVMTASRKPGLWVCLYLLIWFIPALLGARSPVRTLVQLNGKGQLTICYVARCTLYGSQSCLMWKACKTKTKCVLYTLILYSSNSQPFTFVTSQSVILSETDIAGSIIFQKHWAIFVFYLWMPHMAVKYKEPCCLTESGRLTLWRSQEPNTRMEIFFNGAAPHFSNTYTQVLGCSLKK